MERKNCVHNYDKQHVDGAAAAVAAVADNNDDSCNQRICKLKQKVKVPSCQWKNNNESGKMFGRCRKSNSQLCATTSKAGTQMCREK